MGNMVSHAEGENMNSTEDIKLDRLFSKICGDIRLREPGPGLRASILESISKVNPQKADALRKDQPNGDFPFLYGCLRFNKLIPATSLAAGVLIIAAIFSAFPGFAEAVKNYIMKLTLGKRTHIIQINPPGELRGKKITLRVSQGGEKVEVIQSANVVSQEKRPKTWTLNTPVGSFEGNVPEGGSPSMTTYGTLGETRRFLPALLYPAYLPRQYKFQKAVLSPSKDIFLFFSGPGGGIVMRQSADKKSAVVSGTTDPAIERVKLGGKNDAVWLAGDHNLLWEREDVAYALGGRTLGKEEAVKIAGSIK
jgi:hypothetical protein